MDTTNDALKAAIPGLVYEEIKVERSDVFEPFGRWDSWYGSSGFIQIDNEIMAVAEIVDDQTLLVGRTAS